jgi:hypothetical protein
MASSGLLWLLAAVWECLWGAMQQIMASLTLKLSALSVAASPAPQQSDEASMQDATLASLPIEILSLVHSRLLRADPSLRNCLALEATCKHLRSTLHSSTRFVAVSVEGVKLATTQEPGSFWSWIAAHGRRTDRLLFRKLELRHSTPSLCSQAGVLQAGAVAVSTVLIETLEPLRGLLNLASLVCHPSGARDGVSLAPLAGLPALSHIELGASTETTTSLAPLCSLAALSSLSTCSLVSNLDDLSSLSALKALTMCGFPRVTSAAPLSCLTSLEGLALVGFPSLDNVAPLHALSRLQRLTLVIMSTRSFSLQPLCQLTSLRTLSLLGSRSPHGMAEYDLQPLSALSRSLRVLCLQSCVLRNLPSIGSPGMALRSLTLVGCKHQPPGLQLASLVCQLCPLTRLEISDTTAADLEAVGQQLTCLQGLSVRPADNVTSLAALAPLTRLSFLSLDSCSHLSSIDPLAALTGLQSLQLRSCPQLTSLSTLTALQSLQQLRLKGCPQLAASLPASLQRLVIDAGQDV